MNRGGNIGVRHPAACALHSHGMKPNFVPTRRSYVDDDTRASRASVWTTQPRY